MNITEMISKLEQFKEEHGDLKICVCGEYDIEINQGLLLSEETEWVCFIGTKDEEDEE